MFFCFKAFIWIETWKLPTTLLGTKQASEIYLAIFITTSFDYILICCFLYLLFLLLLFFIFNYLFVSLFILSGAGYCDGKADGNYRDPDNCYGYIACSNQIVYKMSCSSGLKYNEKLDQCDWPENVQCSPGKVHLLFSQRIFIISHCNVTKLSNWPLLFITYHGRVGGMSW